MLFLALKFTPQIPTLGQKNLPAKFLNPPLRLFGKAWA